MESVEAAEPFPDEVLPQNFEVDADLSPLQAVMEWAAEGNPPAQRVAYILSIPAAAAESSLEEARNVLLPLLSQLAFDDHPDVKQATAEVLGPLGPILSGKDAEAAEQGSSDALDLLVLAHRLLQDPERGVQEAAANSVAMFAGLLSYEHRHEHLSAVIDALMHNYDDEQMQECAVELLTKVAAAVGPSYPDWCLERGLPRMLKLALHRDYNIRVHTVGGLVQLASCIPEQERTGDLLSTFADLCRDPVWSVRQDCASELSALAQRLPREAVRDHLLPLWQQLVGDVSAWVQAAAKRQAGPLLATIHPDDCTDALLEVYAAAAAGPATLTEACAHFLPAVLTHLGPQRWPRLRDAVCALAGCEYVSVRVALADSMHQLAALLGPQLVAEDLLPVIEKLTTDSHQAVADALAINIQQLLAALPPSARLAQLGFLSRMHPEDGSSCGQWRMRLLIADQLSGIAALLGQQGLAEVLLPATLRLCEDPVAAVRDAAARQLGLMVARLLPQATGSGGGSGGGAGSARGSRSSSTGEEGREEEQQQGAAAEGGESTEGAEAAQQGAAAAGAAAAAAAAAGQAPAGQQQQQEGQQQPAHGQQPLPQQQGEGEEQHGVPDASAAAAVVQQIVRHMVELQRSRCHRDRQTYLAFCFALLAPPAAAEQREAAQAATSPPPSPNKQQQEQQQQQQEAAPQLPEAVASSSIVQGVLEGALALAADSVPNVRMGVARLLAALQARQPQLAAYCPGVGEALQALAVDSDRDVQQAAAGGL